MGKPAKDELTKLDDKHFGLMNSAYHDGWLYCRCEIAKKLRSLRGLVEKQEPIRLVLGEGHMRYTMTKRLVLEIDRKGEPIIWPDLPKDPRVRLILEII